MNDLASTYAIPPELMQFIDSGFLEVLVEEPEKGTVHFHIPSKRLIDTKGRITAYAVYWIHPEKNAENCWYYLETPGDLPNFWISIQREESAEESVDDLETSEDLVEWLGSLQKADIY